MKLTIEIEMDNAAFEEENGTEVARILRELCYDYEGRDILPDHDTRHIFDVNGNKSGMAWVTE